MRQIGLKNVRRMITSERNTISKRMRKFSSVVSARFPVRNLATYCNHLKNHYVSSSSCCFSCPTFFGEMRALTEQYQNDKSSSANVGFSDLLDFTRCSEFKRQNPSAIVAWQWCLGAFHLHFLAKKINF